MRPQPWDDTAAGRDFSYATENSDEEPLQGDNNEGHVEAMLAACLDPDERVEHRSSRLSSSGIHSGEDHEGCDQEQEGEEGGEEEYEEEETDSGEEDAESPEALEMTSLAIQVQVRMDPADPHRARFHVSPSLMQALSFLSSSS